MKSLVVAVPLVASALVLAAGSALADSPLGTLDQAQQTTSSLNQGFDHGGPAYVLGQTFTSALTGTLDTVDVYVAYAGDIFGGSTYPLGVSITATNSSGIPTGPALAQVDFPASNGFGWNRIGFGSPPTVTAGTTYALVLTQPAQAGGIVWPGICSNGYSRGEAVVKEGPAAWQTNATFQATSPNAFKVGCSLDFAFRTYVTADADQSASDGASTSASADASASASADASTEGATAPATGTGSEPKDSSGGSGVLVALLAALGTTAAIVARRSARRQTR